MVKNDFPEVPQSLVDTLRTGSQYLGICLFIKNIDSCSGESPKRWAKERKDEILATQTV